MKCPGGLDHGCQCCQQVAAAESVATAAETKRCIEIAKWLAGQDLLRPETFEAAACMTIYESPIVVTTEQRSDKTIVTFSRDVTYAKEQP